MRASTLRSSASPTFRRCTRLGLPDDLAFVAVVTLGYLAEQADEPSGGLERVHRAAQAPRGGRALGALVRLDHVVIAVSDWERSNAFYRDVLGGELVELDRGRWAYRFGEQQLNVHGPGSTPSPRALRPVEPGNSDLCFLWAGPIDDAVEHLSKAGSRSRKARLEGQARGRGDERVLPRPRRSLLGIVHLLRRLKARVESAHLVDEAASCSASSGICDLEHVLRVQLARSRQVEAPQEDRVVGDGQLHVHEVVVGFSVSSQGVDGLAENGAASTRFSRELPGDVAVLPW